eukprot:scaffold20390_cov107-Isochrysis_galbana.AAC.1
MSHLQLEGWGAHGTGAVRAVPALRPPQLKLLQTATKNRHPRRPHCATAPPGRKGTGDRGSWAVSFFCVGALACSGGRRAVCWSIFAPPAPRALVACGARARRWGEVLRARDCRRLQSCARRARSSPGTCAWGKKGKRENASLGRGRGT